MDVRLTRGFRLALALVICAVPAVVAGCSGVGKRAETQQRPDEPPRAEATAVSGSPGGGVAAESGSASGDVGPPGDAGMSRVASTSGGPALPRESPRATRPLGPTTRVSLETAAGQTEVWLYVPETPGPLVVVVHGFTRRAADVSDWGPALVAEGYTVALPTLPSFRNRQHNGRAVADMVDQLTRNGSPVRLPTTRVALMGHSAGGLWSLEAAATLSGQVAAYVGLDPVDRAGQGLAAASGVTAPALLLHAPPSAFNARANSTGWVSRLPSAVSMSLLGTDHFSPESPTRARGGGAYFDRAVEALQAHLPATRPLPARPPAGGDVNGR